jgi:hypothetical protein
MTTDQEKRAIARDNGLWNVQPLWDAAIEADVPFHVACALIEKESHGRHVWGNDEGGMLAGFPEAVNERTFRAFWWMVEEKGHQSNGVGPCQITSRGLLRQMLTENLAPWVPFDNMLFGLRLLRKYHREQLGSWAAAGTRYNGSVAYGADLADKIKVWKERFDG